MVSLLRLALGSLLAALAAAGVHAQVPGAGVSTDRTQYQAGDTITICYTVPGPGHVAIIDYSSDGSNAVLLDVNDDGSGWCFPVIAQGPASTEQVVMSWSGANGSATAETTYQVVDTAGPRILTLADSNSTITVSVGDTIQAKLGSGLNWHLSVSDPTVLQPAPGPLPADVQGAWVAGSPGQATIVGQGDPPCYPRCLAPSRLFTVTVNVAQARASSSQGSQGMATVRGSVVLSVSGGAAPPAGVSPQSFSTAAGPNIPVDAVVAGDGTATPVATAITDDMGTFMLALPPRSYWIFIPRAAANSTPRLSAGNLQRLPDGTPAVAWAATDLTAGTDASVTLRVSVAAP